MFSAELDQPKLLILLLTQVNFLVHTCGIVGVFFPVSCESELREREKERVGEIKRGRRLICPIMVWGRCHPLSEGVLRHSCKALGVFPQSVEEVHRWHFGTLILPQEMFSPP